MHPVVLKVGRPEEAEVEGGRAPGYFDSPATVVLDLPADGASRGRVGNEADWFPAS